MLEKTWKREPFNYLQHRSYGQTRIYRSLEKHNKRLIISQLTEEKKEEDRKYGTYFLYDV